MVFTITRCGPNLKIVSDKRMRVIQKSHSVRPQWTVQPPEDSADFYYSVGVKTDAPTLEGGETDARMDAGRKFIERFFGVEASAEYKKVRKSYQTEIMEELKGKTKGKIAGARVKEVYWEKLEVSEGGFTKYRYNVWVLIEISKEATRQVLNESLERMNKTVALAKKFLNEFGNAVSEKGEEETLSILEDLKASLSEYDDPEIVELRREIENRSNELKKKIRRIGIVIGGENKEIESVSAEITNLFTESGYYAVKLPFTEKEKALLQANESGLKFLLYGRLDVNITGTQNAFFFADAKGNIYLFSLPSGDIITSISVSERGAGTEENRAISNALYLSLRRIKQELISKIKELP